MGEEILILDVKKTCGFADIFIIATANSRTQIKAISDYIEIKLKEDKEKPIAVDGILNTNWGVLDYGDIVIHVFIPETRSFYNLERLWGDAEIIKY